MERRFAARRDQILADAEVDPRILRGVLPRLERFLDPFVEVLQRSEQGGHARSYVAGLVSDLEYKNVESIAYLHDQPREPLQQFIGQSPWDHGPWLAELAGQVGRELGDPDGVLVLDPSAFPKKGDASVGVQRQWCGRLGKIDNCQVGVYLAYVGRSEHALVDVRLYLPKEWAKDKRRREQAGVPREVRFRTRHELALEMLDERGPLAAARLDRRRRRDGSLFVVSPGIALTERAVFAGRAVEHGDAGPVRRRPVLCRHGRRPRPPFTRMDRWRAGVAEEAWQTIEVARARKARCKCRSCGRWCRRVPRAGRRTWRRFWWCSVSGKATARGSTTTCCPTRR